MQKTQIETSIVWLEGIRDALLYFRQAFEVKEGKI